MKKYQQEVSLGNLDAIGEIKIYQSQEKLRLLMLKFDSMLVNFPDLKQELELILANEALLEADDKLLQRIEVTLQEVTQWVNKVDLMPIELAEHKGIKELVLKFQTTLNLKNASSLIARFAAMHAEVVAEYDALDELIIWADRHCLSDYHFDEDSQWWSGLPRDKDVLLSLTTLDLRHGQFSTIPECIGGLAKLKRLNLRDGHLHHLPDSIGSLANLEILDLSHNQLQYLPETIGHLANLKGLCCINQKNISKSKSYKIKQFLNFL